MVIIKSIAQTGVQKAACAIHVSAAGIGRSNCTGRCIFRVVFIYTAVKLAYLFDTAADFQAQLALLAGGIHKACCFILRTGVHVDADAGSSRFFGDDIDYAADSVRAVEGGAVAADDFDTFNIGNIDTLQLVGIFGALRIFCCHTLAVDKNQCVHSAVAAHLYLIAGHAVILYVNIICQAQGILYAVGSQFFNLLLGNNLNALRNLFFLQLCLGCGNNVIRTAVFIVIICLRSKCHMADCADNAGSKQGYFLFV